MDKKILFRTDAGEDIGAGHLLRCIALAQEAKKAGFDVRFLTNTSEKKWLELLEDQGFYIEKLDLTKEDLGKSRDVDLIKKAITNFKPSWVVLDNYYFDRNYQKAVRDEGVKLICIDDVAENRFCSDILINHGIQAKRLKYNTEPYTKKLFGTEYALIRREFLDDNLRGQAPGKTNKNILVTLGGWSNEDVFLKLSHALGSFKDFNIRILSTITLNMKDQYIWADLIVGAPGGTCWESCYYGITGVVGILSENQALVADELQKRGVFESVGWFKEASQEHIVSALKKMLSVENEDKVWQMKNRARELVDGMGAKRILSAIEGI